MSVRRIDDVAAAAARLAAGGLVAFPTETVYGLGADAGNPQALARIYAAKQRPTTHPLIVHLAAAEGAGRDAPENEALSDAVCSDWVYWPSDAMRQTARRLAAAFWPGPLTLVLPRAAHVLDAVTGGQETVALRCPAHPLAQALLAAFAAIKRRPAGLAAPSANLFGHVSPTTAAHVQSEFAASEEEIWVLDGAAAQVGIESTIVDLSRLDTGTGPVLLRPGQISAAQIAAVLGSPVWLPETLAANTPTLSTLPTPRVSGSLRAHYAPRTPLYLLSTAVLRQQVQAGKRAAPHSSGKTAVWHFAGLDLPAPSSPADIDFFLAPAQAAAYARQLYAQLRAFDAAACYARILIEQPPSTPEWAGVRDRLSRAAAAFDGF